MLGNSIYSNSLSVLSSK